VVVVDDLDEWLDLASLGLAGFRHTTSYGRWVTFDTSDQGVRVWVALVTDILWLDDHDLLSGISATGDDGDSADLKKFHLAVVSVVVVLVVCRIFWNRKFQDVGGTCRARRLRLPKSLGVCGVRYYVRGKSRSFPAEVFREDGDRFPDDFTSNL